MAQSDPRDHSQKNLIEQLEQVWTTPRRTFTSSAASNSVTSDTQVLAPKVSGKGAAAPSIEGASLEGVEEMASAQNEVTTTPYSYTITTTSGTAPITATPFNITDNSESSELRHLISEARRVITELRSEIARAENTKDVVKTARLQQEALRVEKAIETVEQKMSRGANLELIKE